MREAWLSEWLMLGALLTGALLGSVLIGHAGLFFLAAVVIFLSRHLYQLYRLERWLRIGRRRNPPESWGIWGEVFEHYYRLQRRYYKRKKRLARVIREFRESTAAMPDAALVLDGEMRILWFNDAARESLRLSPARDLGQPIVNLIRAPAFKRYLHSGPYDRMVDFASPVHDSRTLSARLIPYGADQNLLMIRDVTRLHRLQAMRRDFVANASHELRSPLTVLAGYLEALNDEKSLGADWQGPVEEMLGQCRRMNSLVNDLLEISRMETEEADAPVDDVVDVHELIDRILQYARTEDGARHEIDFESARQAGVAGEERELYSAFSNLVTNALRYTPEGGRVTVRWYPRPGGEWVFEVEDNGIGIEKKHISFITQRFYRVDSSHSRKLGGTGLGLAIVKHVLQRHNALLEVDSTLGQGSVFRCVFPQARCRVDTQPAIRSVS